MRGVELESLLEGLPLLLGEHGVHEPPDLGSVEHVELGQLLHVAVDSHAWRQASGEVQVRATEVEHALEELVEVQLGLDRCSRILAVDSIECGE